MPVGTVAEGTAGGTGDGGSHSVRFEHFPADVGDARGGGTGRGQRRFEGAAG